MNETDPSGLLPNESGVKLDDGKNRLGLVLGDFSQALWEVGKVGTFGAKKYSDGGWLQVPNGQQRYLDALYRHLLYNQANPYDSQSGLLHLSHAAWNALAILELNLREKAQGFN